MDEEAMQRWQCGKRASEEAVAGFHDRIRAQTFNPSRYTVGVGGFRLNFKSFAIDISRTSVVTPVVVTRHSCKLNIAGMDAIVGRSVLSMNVKGRNRGRFQKVTKVKLQKSWIRLF